MIPPTRHGLPAIGCISLMQKAIRRNAERLAMEAACELINTSKAQCSMVANRLVVISHEDIDVMAQPIIIPFVFACAQTMKEMYQPENPGKSRMAAGSAIRLMARAPKSREGDHFQAAIGLRNLFGLPGGIPEIPDWANDGHTMKGKRMGRGVEFFRAESTKLVPPQAGAPDAYEDEAYKMWEEKERRGKADKENGDLDV